MQPPYPEKGEALSKFMDDPLLVLTNVVLSFVFIIIGIVRFATRKKRSL